MDVLDVRRLEFWPDYGGVLLHQDGAPVALETLDLPVDLARRAAQWVAAYDDRQLAPESRDEAWIAEGRAIFGGLREALAAVNIDLVDWEGIWEAAPDA
jgi:hypothetical protein